MNNYKMSSNNKDDICACNNNCSVFQSSFGNMINNIIHEELINKLNKLQIPNYQIFTNDRKIFHIKWYEQSSVLHRRALDSIIISILKPIDITHYEKNIYNDNIIECQEFNNTFDFNYAHKFFNTLNHDNKFSDLTNKYQDVCAFYALRNTDYEYLTLYNKYKKIG